MKNFKIVVVENPKKSFRENVMLGAAPSITTELTIAANDHHTALKIAFDQRKWDNPSFTIVDETDPLTD